MISDQELQALLRRSHTIAIVGMSDKPNRDSFQVARFLQRNGFRIIPVNPALSGPVLGEQPYASLRAIPMPVDIVNIFRRPEFVAGVVDDAIAIRAKAVWTQLGIKDVVAGARARAAGLTVVMDRCVAIEHRRLMRYAELVS